MLTLVTKDDDKRGSYQNAWAAKQDAIAQSEQHELLYTETQKVFAGLVQTMVASAYTSRVYLTYRKKYCTVKVASPTVREMLNPAVGRLERSLAGLDAGIVRVRTKTSVIYRIPR